MSINIRDYVSDDHIESIGEIATGQARIIQALLLDNSQKDKEIERLITISNDYAKRIIKAIEYIEQYTKDTNFVNGYELLDILKGVDKE